MKEKEFLIQICTYNEIENIPKLLPILLDYYGEECNVLVIDDSSPDGTGDWVREYSKKKSQVNCIIRNSKKGRGLASLAGYQFFMKSDHKWLIEIDADFSHDYRDIAKLIANRSKADIIIGSRYLDKTGFGDYPLKRVLLSKVLNYFMRLLLGIKPLDASQSFQLIPREYFKTIHPNQFKSEGFSLFLEIKYLAQKYGFTMHEIPITISDRVKGETKLSIVPQLISIIKMYFLIKYSFLLERIQKIGGKT